ncbi:MAG: cupin [Kordiimonadales bacterium]|nr:MAG: cupin [Kordiimonadales bacterium]
MFNMDFSRRVVINTQQQSWLPTRQQGIWRKPLAREDAERGHATSIVRYDAGAKFAAHNHLLGEEIFVLEGTFSNESRDFPAGSYLRNPKCYRHAPFSKEGCTLLVKLNQFQNGDDHHINVGTRGAEWFSGNGNLRVMPLHQFGQESTALVFWPAGEHFLPHHHAGGEEIYVVSGEFIDEYGRYPAGSWIRSPHMSKHDPHVEQDTLILVKVGHLSRL